MNYLEALANTHKALNPVTYCEIGCRQGVSLALARSPSVAIDPDFALTHEIVAPVKLFRMESDAFFATHDLKTVLGGPVDFAFIDGMHLVEYALRDFINLEKSSHAGGVIAIDDVLPQDIQHTTRVRETQAWTGDVYRLIPLLRHFRPDLDIRVYDVDLKGYCLVSNLDPSSTVLAHALPGIEARLAKGDWTQTSLARIHDEMGPRDPGSLATDLAVIAAGRKPAVGEFERQANLYLDLLKRSILNKIYLDDELRILYLRRSLEHNAAYVPSELHDIRSTQRAFYERLQASREVGQFVDRAVANCGFSHSMMGRKRLDSLHDCLDDLHRRSVPGDLVECGVWRGGGCIFMAGFLRVHGITNRRVLVADSFEGLPPSTNVNDLGLELHKEVYPQLAVSLDIVRENFEVYDLLDEKIQFIKGWFKDSLSLVETPGIALLRLDGDLYESTTDILVNLYERVVSGGIVIVDDYNAIPACRKAIQDFFAGRGESLPEIIEIDWTGVFFVKP